MKRISYLGKSAIGFAVVMSAAALPASEAPAAVCPNACVSGCNLDQDEVCRRGGGEECVASGCSMYFFHCIGVTMYQVTCTGAL